MFAATKQFLTPAVVGGISSISESISENFLLWLDAVDYNGTTWTAKKGTSPTKNGTVTSSTYNGFPSVLFGTGGYFTIPSFVAPSSLAVFAVLYQPPGKPLIIEQSTNANSNNGFYFYTDSFYPYAVFRSSVGTKLQFNKTDNTDWFDDGSFGLGAINFDGSSLTINYNGTTVPNSVYSGTISSYNLSTDATNTLHIGSRAGAIVFFETGHLCELIISPSLSNEDYSTVTENLKVKYSL